MTESTGFSAIQQSESAALESQKNSIASDATLDMTDPQNLMQLKYDMDNYSTAVQTQLGIEDALQTLRKAIAQSIGQA